MRAFFVVPGGTSYFPLGPPLRGKVALRAIFSLDFSCELFQFHGFYCFSSLVSPYAPPLILEGVARKFLSHNRLVDFRVNVLQTLKSTNYLIINLLRITHNVSSLKWLDCAHTFVWAFSFVVPSGTSSTASRCFRACRCRLGCSSFCSNP